MRSYRVIFDIFAQYWCSYGGWPAIIRSPYLHIAMALTAFTFPAWCVPGWWDQPTSILPNLMGFTLGGYAMLMAFGDEKFMSKMVGRAEGQEISPYLQISATFVHFIVIQVLALVLSIVAKARPLSGSAQAVRNSVGAIIPEGSFIREALVIGFWGFSYLVFLYAILLTVAAAIGIFRVSRWYELYQEKQGDAPESSDTQTK